MSSSEGVIALFAEPSRSDPRHGHTRTNSTMLTLGAPMLNRATFLRAPMPVMDGVTEPEAETTSSLKMDAMDGVVVPTGGSKLPPISGSTKAVAAEVRREGLELSSFAQPLKNQRSIQHLCLEHQNQKSVPGRKRRRKKNEGRKICRGRNF